MITSINAHFGKNADEKIFAALLLSPVRKSNAEPAEDATASVRISLHKVIIVQNWIVLHLFAMHANKKMAAICKRLTTGL